MFVLVSSNPELCGRAKELEQIIFRSQATNHNTYMYVRMLMCECVCRRKVLWRQREEGTSYKKDKQCRHRT